MSNISFARFNIQFDSSANEASITEIQDMLFNAALWATAEDPEVFYEENNNIVGISVAIGDSSMSILEAGAILGQCEGAYESSEFDKGKVTWFSIHDDKGGVIETTYDPNA